MFVLITFLLLISLVLNVVLVWYIRRVILEIAPLHERTLALRESLEEFAHHVEGVYELPTFYGEPVLLQLLEHTRAIASDVQ